MMSRLNMDHLQNLIKNWSLQKFWSKALSWFETCSRASSVSSPCVFINEINFEIKSYESSDLFCSWKRIKKLGWCWEIFVGEKYVGDQIWNCTYSFVKIQKILLQHTFFTNIFQPKTSFRLIELYLNGMSFEIENNAPFVFLDLNFNFFDSMHCYCSDMRFWPSITSSFKIFFEFYPSSSLLPCAMPLAIIMTFKVSSRRPIKCPAMTHCPERRMKMVKP